MVTHVRAKRVLTRSRRDPVTWLWQVMRARLDGAPITEGKWGGSHIRKWQPKPRWRGWTGFVFERPLLPDEWLVR